MRGGIDYDTLAAPPEPSPRIGAGVVMSFVAVGLTTCLVVAILLIGRARNESAAIAQRAVNQAVALSLAFDQEIAAVNYLLKGLAKSPALVSGDLKRLYDQFKETDVPAGTWLLYQDLDKQLVNSSRQFGDKLPQHNVYPNYHSILDNIRERRWTVSGRIVGPATGKVVVALNLRVDGADGQMTNILTSILSESRLRAILNDRAAPAEWERGLYDKQFQPIVTLGGPAQTFDLGAPSDLAAHIQSAGPEILNEGMFHDKNENGDPILVTFRYSASTNWTTVIRLPIAAVTAPIDTALWQIGGLAGFVILSGGMAVLFANRNVERPFRALSDRLNSSKKQVHELSGQLLALQEEERQRIARELHDSTAQHLVAASLGLAGLANELKANRAACKALTQVDELLAKALTELRIFTYLLHPPDLARDGLQATLRLFIEGFAGRTGLAPTIRIPQEIDRVCPHVQWSILRIVQEALANVHRHAGASRVSVRARVTTNRLVVQIRDDGQGMGGISTTDAPVRFGVGIPGMRARLKQFGGDLRIRTGRGGTTVVANVPLSTTALATGRIIRSPGSVSPHSAVSSGSALH